MKIAIYSTKSYDRKYIELINAKYNFDLEFFDFMLNESTARLTAYCEIVGCRLSFWQLKRLVYIF